MKLFSPAEIRSLLDNQDDLKQAIIDSKGFVLYLADKYQITLSPDLLIETICPYSLRFIANHMDSHKYSEYQQDIYQSYIKEDEKTTLNGVKNYDLKTLFADIVKENEIPGNAGSLLNLTFDDFLKYPKEFVKLIESDPENDNFFNTHNLLEGVFSNLTKEDFLQIDKKILDECPSLFNMAGHLLGDNDIKVLFNSSVDLYFKRPEVINSKQKTDISIYRNYHFEKEEKELFINLLNNGRDAYYRVKRINGFSNMFEKSEYIIQHSIASIVELTEQEISANIAEIRHSILKKYFPAYTFKDINWVYGLDISTKSLKEIFSPEFIKEVFNVPNLPNTFMSFNFNVADNHYSSDVINVIYFVHQEVLTLCANDNDILLKTGYKVCAQRINDIYSNRTNFFIDGNDSFLQASRGILNKFDIALDSDYLFENFDHLSANSYVAEGMLEVIFPSMKGKESINYLYSLIRISQRQQQLRNVFLEDEISRVVPLLNKADVQELSKILYFQIDERLMKDNSRGDFNNNFLNFNPEVIKTMDISYFKHMWKISGNFRAMLLENNLDTIIIDDSLKNNGSKSEIISQMLHSLALDGKDSEYYSFAKAFINKHKDFMIEHYLPELIGHKLREDLIFIDTSKVEEKSYRDLEVLADLLLKKELDYTRTPITLPSRLDPGTHINNPASAALFRELLPLRKKAEMLFSNIGFDFYSQKIKDSTLLKSIALYNASNGPVKNEYLILICKKFEDLDFLSTKNLLSNQHFLVFLHANKASKYDTIDGKYRIIFNPSFSNEQNKELIETLFLNSNNPDFYKPNDDNKDGASLSKVLYLLRNDRKLEISNELVIKLAPLDFFNSFDYCSPTSHVGAGHVVKSFSTQDILEAVANLNKLGLKIFGSEINHGDCSATLRSNYSYNNKEKVNPKLVEYLDLLKGLENDPINYLACIHHEIIENFIDTKDGRVSKDMAKTIFYEKYINSDVVLMAMREILSINKEFHESKKALETNKVVYRGIHLEASLKAITRFITFTYSSPTVYSKSDSETKESDFSEHKSRAILQTIIHEAPYLSLSLTAIGKINSVSEEIAENFSKYYHENFIEDFFINSGKNQIISSIFSINNQDKGKWQSENAENLIENLIKFLIETKDTNGLYKLDFILKEHVFSDTIHYTKALKDFQPNLTEFMNSPSRVFEMEKSINYVNMLKFTDTLDKKKNTITNSKSLKI